MVESSRCEKGGSTEPIRSAALPSSFRGLGAFQKLPIYAGLQLGCQLAGIGVVIAELVPLMILAKYHPTLTHGWRGFTIAFCWIVPAVISGFFATRRMTFRFMIWSKLRDLKVLGQPHTGQFYVGIAYCAGDWAYRGDTSWDRGHVCIVGGELRFRGFGPSFSLPLSFIKDVRMIFTKSPFTNSLPRIYIHWSAPGGLPNTLSLEIRDAGSRPATIRETEKISNWLEEERSKNSATVSSTALPFESTQIDLSDIPSVQLNDQLIAGACTVASIGFWLVVEEAIHRFLHVKTDWLTLVCGATSMAIYNSVVYSRVRKRAKVVSSAT